MRDLMDHMNTYTETGEHIINLIKLGDGFKARGAFIYDERSSPVAYYVPHDLDAITDEDQRIVDDLASKGDQDNILAYLMQRRILVKA